MKSPLGVSASVLCLLLAIFAAGCGDSGSSSDPEGPASIAPPQSPLFIEGTVLPNGQLKANVDQIANTVAGVDNLGNLIVSELESSAEDEGEPFDFNQEVKPWLGERAGAFFERFDGEDFTELGFALESTDTSATQEFIDTQVENSNDPVNDGSYDGVDYWVDTGDDTVIGLIGDFFVQTEGTKAFEHAVDASNGDSLSDQDAFQDAIAAAQQGSLADVYVDVGGLIEQGEEEIDDSALQALESAGIDPREATAIASIVPGSDQVEINISSDTGDQEAPTGDASELLGSLPGNAFAAFAVSGFGEQLEEALDQLDETGIPGQIPPNQLKDTLKKELDFDLDKLAASLEDAGLFASGSSERDIGGAFVLTADDSSEVATVVRLLGTLIRQTDTPGVTALSGEASGFSVRDPEELGPQPLVVATKGDRIAIGYGVKPTLLSLTPSSSTLADSPNYKAAVKALGGTQISGFVDGPGALRLADSFVPSSEAEFEEAKRYLDAIRFIALGSGTEGDRATAKLIVGLQE